LNGTSKDKRKKPQHCTMHEMPHAANYCSPQIFHPNRICEISYVGFREATTLLAAILWCYSSGMCCSGLWSLVYGMLCFRLSYPCLLIEHIGVSWPRIYPVPRKNTVGLSKLIRIYGAAWQLDGNKESHGKLRCECTDFKAIPTLFQVCFWLPDQG
jgi:hypothetical protein